MAESQSRYGIVADLTNSKLEIINAKSHLEGDVKQAKQKAQELESDLMDWKESIKAENERQLRDKQREIERAKREAINAEDRKKSKEIALNEKIKAIDVALEDIKSISESSAKEASK